MRRIAFAGASGTGKTTLARWVSDAWERLIRLVDDARLAKKSID